MRKFDEKIERATPMSDDRGGVVQYSEDSGALGLIRSALRAVDEIGTGLVGTDKLQLFMIPGRLIQALRNKGFLEQLASELEQLRAKGAIRRDFMESESGKSCASELFSALERPPVDHEKFRRLKAVFLAAADSRWQPEVETTPQFLLQVAGGLSTGAVVVAATAYRIGRDQPNLVKQVGEIAASWSKAIANNSNLKLQSLVEFYEMELIERKIVTRRTYPDNSGAHRGQMFRLTDLGVSLCEYIEKGLEIEEELVSQPKSTDVSG